MINYKYKKNINDMEKEVRINCVYNGQYFIILNNGKRFKSLNSVKEYLNKQNIDSRTDIWDSTDESQEPIEIYYTKSKYIYGFNKTCRNCIHFMEEHRSFIYDFYTRECNKNVDIKNVDTYSYGCEKWEKQDNGLNNKTKKDIIV